MRVLKNLPKAHNSKKKKKKKKCVAKFFATPALHLPRVFFMYWTNGSQVKRPVWVFYLQHLNYVLELPLAKAGIEPTSLKR